MLYVGPVAPVAFAAPRMVEETSVGVDFEPNPLHCTVHRDDKVYMVAYIPEKEAFIISQPFYRGQKYVEIVFPSYLAGKEIYLWGFVVDRAGRASQSQYLGNGIIDQSQWPESYSEEKTVNEWIENGKSIRDIFAYVAIESQIARLELLRNAQHILKYQHLSVNTVSGANANNWNLDFGSYACGQRCRDFFEHHSEAACLFEDMCIVNDTVGFVFLGGAYGIGTELVDALWGETEVSHNGYAGAEDALYGFEYLFAAFEFDGIGSGFFHNAYSRSKSLLGVALICAERHIDNNKGTVDGTNDGGGVNNHLVERDGQGGFVAFHNIGCAVAHQYNINLSTVK